MKSYWNKILKVDLSNGTCKAEELSDDVYEKFGVFSTWKVFLDGITNNIMGRLSFHVKFYASHNQQISITYAGIKMDLLVTQDFIKLCYQFR